MKTNILALLKRQYPESISGEEISNSLKVSRTAIWKHIQTLREEGYEIDSQPRVGYKLVKVPDRLYPQEITEGLKSKKMGHSVVYFDSTTSTNDVAKELANQGFDDGSIIVAEKQLQGKGRLGRNWSSPHGQGISFTVILRPPISPTEAHKFTILAGVAVAEAINSHIDAKAGIKWPNDILINGKKVCGILTEMNAEMEKVNYIVIGIGINVNMTKKAFPKDLQDKATSLRVESGRKLNRVALLQDILVRLEDLNTKFLEGKYNYILDRWKALSVTINSSVTVTTLKDQFTGKAVDIDPDGALIVKLANGKNKKVVAGEVTLSKRKL